MTLEVEDYHFTVDNPDSRPIVTNCPVRNKVIEEYTAKEMALYRGMSNKAEDFAEASQFWRNIANPDGTINSAYGYLLWSKNSCGNPRWYNEGIKAGDCDWMTPWEWAKRSLIKDLNTRQAYLRFSLPEHQWFGNKDQVCTMHGLFLIRDHRLNLSIVMRSNDLFKGLAYDLPFFIFLMEKMIDELDQLGIKLDMGQYRHMAHSLHIYENDIPRVKDMIGIS